MNTPEKVDIPTFRARVSRHGDGLVFDCPHCGTAHLHGGILGGHRAHHCHKPNTPFAKGYYLEPVT